MDKINNSKKKNKLIFSHEAREKLFRGIDQTAQAVGTTMGPKGKTVLIQEDDKMPIVTKDGVTVCRSIQLSDPVEAMGSELVKQAATRTNDVAGDGTTTATVLTHALVSEGLKMLTAGHDSIELKRELEVVVREISDKIRLRSKKIKSHDEIVHVGTISANGDKDVGKIIAYAVDKVGQSGIVTVEEARGTETSVHVVDGMMFPNGFLSPYFVTNPEKMSAVYENCYVLVTDKKIDSLQSIVGILEWIHGKSASLLIIADEVAGDALQGIVLNKVKSGLKVVAVKAPSYGKMRQSTLEDIALMTGATFISSQTGEDLSKISHEKLGQCRKVNVDSKSTIIVGLGQNKSEIEKRVEELEYQLDDPSLTELEINNLKTRIARLSKGIGVIRVGGTTEFEMLELKYRIEDALNATWAALSEGIVEGGGIALYDVSQGIKSNTPGARLVKNACVKPFEKIVRNAGLSPTDQLNKLMRTRKRNKLAGIDVSTGKIVKNVFEVGIIDPAKVVRVALENAASVAGTFLSLNAIVYNPEKDDE